MARNKSEKELRAESRTGGNVTIRGGTAMSTRGTWDGQIENIATYNRALSYDEIMKAARGARASINELEKAGLVRTTKRGAVYLASQP